MTRIISILIACVVLVQTSLSSEESLIRIEYNHPDLVVDLGVGLWAWPMPMDFDGDGDFDLVVVCPDKPYNGTWFFENKQGGAKMPVFEPAVRISKGTHNVQVSYVDGQPCVLSPNLAHPDFFEKGIDTPVEMKVDTKGLYIAKGKLRAKQWKRVDYDGDGTHDLVVGYGDWGDYGWD
ncbi:MAG: VCBS repeat-containing protein, partial [Verrucomicrobia bacterium]|nr:VCBS repeat-containing protein [Verrucomicrobiota bacterium]